MYDENSRVCARVDLGAIEYNLEAMKNNIPDGVRIMAVIKTDAYGHGALRIANFLENKDYIWGYATATAEEAFDLRENGIKKPILVLGYTFPYAYEKMLSLGIRPAVFREDMLKELGDCAERLMKSGVIKNPAPIHIAVDTGMSRIGIRHDKSGEEFVKKAFEVIGIEVEGIFTHFARADEKDLSNVKEREQIFAEFVKSAEAAAGKKIPIHQ